MLFRSQARRSNDPAIRRPRRQRRHKNNYGHKNKKFRIPGLPRMHSQPGDTTAADLTAGNTDTSHISFIHDRPSPPPRRDSTPHAPTPTLQQVLDPTKNERQKQKRMARVARYHPYGEGHEQAGRRSPPPQQDSTPHATTTTLQQAHRCPSGKETGTSTRLSRGCEMNHTGCNA